MSTLGGGPGPGVMENHTFDEIEPGDHAEVTHMLSAADLQLLAAVSAGIAPLRVDPGFAQSAALQGVLADGVWGPALLATVLASQYPGPGTLCVGQSIQVLRPVRIGDTLRFAVTVRNKFARNGHVALEFRCHDQHGQSVMHGTAEVVAPREKVHRARAPAAASPNPAAAGSLEALMRRTAGLPPLRTAVAHPCDAVSLMGAMDAARAGHIVPVLVAPAERLDALSKELGIDISDIEHVAVPHSHAAAAKAVELAAQGRVDAIMKGSLHTDELMSAVIAAAGGLRTERRMSHVFVFDIPSYPRPLLITDAAINIAPDLEAKADIVRNAIDLAHALGIAAPRVAILSAVETVNPRVQSTLDAAALCKMADRGQIQGGVLDGPLAYDNAVSPASAETKGIRSPVAGQADVLVVPDLEAGNMLAKQLEYLAGAHSAGVVLGARVPIMLTSRSDPVPSRIASCVLARLLHRHRTMPGAAKGRTHP